MLVCGGLDLGDDRGCEMAEVGLQRTLAAIEDLDADEFLPAPAPTFSRAGTFGALCHPAYRLLKRVPREAILFPGSRTRKRSNSLFPFPLRAGTR